MISKADREWQLVLDIHRDLKPLHITALVAIPSIWIASWLSIIEYWMAIIATLILLCAVFCSWYVALTDVGELKKQRRVGDAFVKYCEGVAIDNSHQQLIKKEECETMPIGKSPRVPSEMALFCVTGEILKLCCE